MKISYKTLVASLIIFAGILFGALSLSFDNDPKTVTDWNDIAKAFAVFLTSVGVLTNGVVARDNKVSDEQAGAGQS